MKERKRGASCSVVNIVEEMAETFTMWKYLQSLMFSMKPDHWVLLYCIWQSLLCIWILIQYPWFRPNSHRICLEFVSLCGRTTFRLFFMCFCACVTTCCVFTCARSVTGGMCEEEEDKRGEKIVTKINELIQKKKMGWRVLTHTVYIDTITNNTFSQWRRHKSSLRGQQLGGFRMDGRTFLSLWWVEVKFKSVVAKKMKDAPFAADSFSLTLHVCSLKTAYTHTHAKTQTWSCLPLGTNSSSVYSTEI